MHLLSVSREERCCSDRTLFPFFACQPRTSEYELLHKRLAMGHKRRNLKQPWKRGDLIIFGTQNIFGGYLHLDNISGTSKDTSQVFPHIVNWYYEINRWACIYCFIVKVLFGSKPKEGIDALLPSNTQLSPYLRFGCLSPRLFHMRLTKAYIQVGFIAVIYFTHCMQLKLSPWVDTFCRSCVSVTWACGLLEWSLQAAAISSISDRWIFMGACAAHS